MTQLSVRAQRKELRLLSAIVMFAIMALPASRPARAQFSRDPYLNSVMRGQAGMRSMADNLADLMQTAGQGAAVKARQAQSIKAARNKFWAAYPNGPGLEQAKAEYEKLLFSKELYYLQLHLPEGRPDKTLSTLHSLMGGDLDSGIPLAVQPAFRLWVEDIRRRMGVRPGEAMPLSALSSLKTAIVESADSYQAYAVKRDLEDFRTARRTPPGLDPLYWETISAMVNSTVSAPWEGDPREEYQRGWMSRDEYDHAASVYQDAVRLFGVEHVTSVAKMVTSARGPVPAPAELGEWRDTDTFQALMNHWGSGDPRRFLIGQLRRSTGLTYWKESEARYERLVSAVGEARVLEAAAKLRGAEKKVYSGVTGLHFPLLKDPSLFGCTLESPGDCAEQMFPDFRRSINRKSAKGGKGSPKSEGSGEGSQGPRRGTPREPSSPSTARSGSDSSPAAQGSKDAVEEVKEKVRGIFRRKK